MRAEDIKMIAVVESGDMGHGIAEVADMTGYNVHIYAPPPLRRSSKSVKLIY